MCVFSHMFVKRTCKDDTACLVQKLHEWLLCVEGHIIVYTLHPLNYNSGFLFKR